MKEQGLKAYRFSVAWTRIFPNGRGEVNQEGLAFYENLIDELIKNDIEPMLTLYHWDLPQALQDEYAGWESRQIIADFTNYAETLFQAFRGKVHYWISLNEQNIFYFIRLFISGTSSWSHRSKTDVSSQSYCKSSKCVCYQ